MGDITSNLSRNEFACKCGCGFDSMDVETIWVVQDVCDHFGCSVTITSANRCPAHNAKVGGAKTSQHLYSRAMDCKFSKIEPEAVHQYLLNKYEGRFGFGLYNTFNHIDTRTGPPARWDKR